MDISRIFMIQWMLIPKMMPTIIAMSEEGIWIEAWIVPKFRLWNSCIFCGSKPVQKIFILVIVEIIWNLGDCVWSFTINIWFNFNFCIFSKVAFSFEFSDINVGLYFFLVFFIPIPVINFVVQTILNSIIMINGRFSFLNFSLIIIQFHECVEILIIVLFFISSPYKHFIYFLNFHGPNFVKKIFGEHQFMIRSAIGAINQSFACQWGSNPLNHVFELYISLICSASPISCYNSIAFCLTWKTHICL